MRCVQDVIAATEGKEKGGKEMSLKYIREHYKVPAKRGLKVIAQGQNGIIVAARGTYLRIRIQGEKNILSFHPTWKIKYPAKGKKKDEEKR